MKSMGRIITSAIDRFMLAKKKISFGSGKKLAVVSYVLYLPFWNKRYFLIKHNNKKMCSLIVESLVRHGYRVVLYDYTNLDADVSKADVFIGHNFSFHTLASKTKKTCKKILLTTGSSPAFDCEQVGSRRKYFHERHGVDLTFDFCNDSHVLPNGYSANAILMMGSDFVINTWPSVYQEKSHSYHNVIQSFPEMMPRFGNGFVFMSNRGAIRRGLDLVVEAFSGLDIPLHIFSPAADESDFFSPIEKIIVRSKNIHFHGFVDTSTEQYLKIISQCGFCILPSCSEAEASSALNLMVHGLIPLLTINTGFTDIESYGLEITQPSVEGIRELVVRASNLTTDELDLKRGRLAIYLEQFKPGNFKEIFSGYLSEICS